VITARSTHSRRVMKTYFIYGLAMAIAGAALAMVLYLLGFHSDPSKLVAAQIIGVCGGLVIGITCITLGTKARREEIPPTEEFGYGRALGAGVMIALFAALFNIVTAYTYAKYINPEFVDVIVQAQMEKLEQKKIPPAQMESVEKMVRKFSGPEVQAASSCLGGILFGTLISLVTAALLKRPAMPPGLETPSAVA